MPRARHWTTLADRWCGGYAPGAMFSGICRVHRVQLMVLEGDWDHAAREAEQAATDLEPLDVTIAAEAHYRVGDLQRLRGDLDAAEAAYRRAHERGRDPLPGMALLHLARGHNRVASSILDAALAVERTALSRAPLLVARIQVELAAAADALGDRDTADREREHARMTLERLGARRDLAHVTSHRGHGVPGELSPREIEVLAVIADGTSNREAAAQLHISERTVARHLANVYLKTGVSSRTGAVAWSRQRGLIRGMQAAAATSA